MLTNYIKIALRNIIRNKGFSFINIFGLAIGVALFTLIMLYVRHEYSFDQFHENKDRTYRLETGDWGIVGPAFGTDLKTHFPEIENSVRIDAREHNPVVAIGENRFRLEHMILADPSLFEVFTFPLLHGDTQTVLSDPFSIVLTESTAQRLFGSSNPVGETLQLFNRWDMTVTGIMKDVERSHIRINAVIPFEFLIRLTGMPGILESHGDWNFQTFTLIKGNQDVPALEEKITDYYAEIFARYNTHREFHLRPLTDIYFANDVVRDRQPARKQKLFIYL